MARPRTSTAAVDPGRPEDYVEVATPFDAKTIARLVARLDPNRIRYRDGSGNQKLEYIAAHDAIRTANELFGFGNWGHRIAELTRIGEVAVLSSASKPGWHVAYSCVVELSVRGPFGEAAAVGGVGYGDGVSYQGELSKLTSSELAMKEAESDAIKRALRAYGDQFGLVLYAKESEKRSLDRDFAVATTEATTRVRVPQNFAEVTAMLAPYGATLGWGEWWAQLLEAVCGTRERSEVEPARWRAYFQKVASIAVRIAEDHPEADSFPPLGRKEIQAAIARSIGGTILDGPPWRLGPDEPDLPLHDEWLAGKGGLPSGTSEAIAGSS